MDERLVQSLLDPGAYDEETAGVRLLQTHVSFLFFTDDHVYKIKKDVDFGFLNFTTLDRRRFYCEEEVRLNRRLCPDLYLGVVEVRESARGLSFHGSGKIVEYAVKMRRLPEGRMLSRLLERGGVTGRDLRPVAREIGRFHLRAERGGEIDAFGDLAVIRRNWEENFRQVREFVPVCLGAGDLELIRGWVERFMAEHGDLFAQRVASGRIRDCDGDIHSDNICLADKVYIFDCIEFNSRFRYSDTAADIAFLLMDLESHGRRDLAEVVLDQYLLTTGDDTLRGVLEFYLVYRAFVRGKVSAFMYRDPMIPPEQRELSALLAGRFFRLARGHVIREGFPPAIIVLCGLMGTGKSTLAREISFELGLETAVSDVIRKELAGIDSTRRCREGYNEGIYSASFTRNTYDEIFRRMEMTLRSGHPILVDASFHRREDRDRVREIAAGFGADCHFVHVVSSDEVLRRRLFARWDDPTAISDGNWELMLRQRADFDLPAPAEGPWVEVDTSSTPVRESVDHILRFLGRLPKEDPRVLRVGVI